jgi:hypothetical protein
MGFVLDEVQEGITYSERPAWAVYYRRDDCKLQVCWSSREGSIDFMLAKPQAQNEFGPRNTARDWHFLLNLSDFDEGLSTPEMEADAETWWRWRNAVLRAHFPDALQSLHHME